jgi:pimeloyl-ACP methyl ester carboxylesterase
MPTPSQLLFLPGATGNTAFWRPLADRLTTNAHKVIVGYPGFGSEPVDERIGSFDDLVERILMHIDQPTAIIAQSMGGVVAVRAALAKPHLVTHLVLVATSGGIDTKGLGAQDWRNGFAESYPSLPDWFISFRSDLTAELESVTQPVLLIWGDADPLSPVAVGQRLLKLLPHAQLHVVAGGNHDLANVYASDLVPIVDAHLQNQADNSR